VKFQIWCTRHDAPALTDDNTIRHLELGVMQVDEDHLYCRYGSSDPTEHTFVLRVKGDVVMIDPPGKIVP